jgi:hypothetical protein
LAAVVGIKVIISIAINAHVRVNSAFMTFQSTYVLIDTCHTLKAFLTNNNSTNLK